MRPGLGWFTRRPHGLAPFDGKPPQLPKVLGNRHGAGHIAGRAIGDALAPDMRLCRPVVSIDGPHFRIGIVARLENGPVCQTALERDP
ncbi:hypothetical protein EV667_4073 [Ancylobacter aquaticus]|uniref:Uncharacterized protein n=1 Tax=Ancylobacter aquaticus TaxID=100 RepID=A0A4R1HC92_ANCAQ|nr:hypothetical protein EV667_4073 [Ancylobacter aquaticus]